MLPNVVTFYAGHQSNLAILTDRMVVGGGGGAQLGKLKLAAICKLMLEQLKMLSVSQKSVNALVPSYLKKKVKESIMFSVQIGLGAAHSVIGGQSRKLLAANLLLTRSSSLFLVSPRAILFVSGLSTDL